MIINFNIAFTKNHEKLFKGLFKTALKYTGAKTKKVSVDVNIVSEREIKEINSKFRGKDSATDVLSFPTLKLTAGERIKLADYKNDIDLNTKSLNLGDIIICTEIAKQQAGEFGHSYDRELCYLFVHGILHLLGFDHEKEEEQLIMRGLEEEVLKKYKITRDSK